MRVWTGARGGASSSPRGGSARARRVLLGLGRERERALGATVRRGHLRVRRRRADARRAARGGRAPDRDGPRRHAARPAAPRADRPPERVGPDEADAPARRPGRPPRRPRRGRARRRHRPVPQREELPPEPAPGRRLRRGLRRRAHAEDGDEGRVGVERTRRERGGAGNRRRLRRHGGLRGDGDERRVRRPHIRAQLHHGLRAGVQPPGDGQGGGHREALVRVGARQGVLGQDGSGSIPPEPERGGSPSPRRRPPRRRGLEHL